MQPIDTECLIVGGGVIGLAIARELSSNNVETILVEKNNCLGEEVSARNSGVIHAGFYYPQTSLKSQFCNLGNKMIYAYCKDKNIYAQKTGKILVSSDKDSINFFNKYKENAIFAGGEALQVLSKSELLNLEPNISSDFCLLSPETGVLDVHSYISSMENDFIKSGGTVALKTKFLNFDKDTNYFKTYLRSENESFEIRSKFLIMTIGLHSDKHINNLPISNKNSFRKINYSKGHYFKLSGKSPFNHLIYPLPTKYGLGIHAGFDIDGSVRFGPDTSWVSEIDYKFDVKLKKKFVTAIHEYWPKLNPEKLHEDYVGIRPKIQKRSETFADFSILRKEEHGLENFIFLQGIESPGLTCSLPIAKFVYNSVIN